MNENRENADTSDQALRIDADTADQALYLDGICDQFEDACQKGEALSIEEFLRRAGIEPSAAPTRLLKDLARLQEAYRTLPPGPGPGQPTATFHPSERASPDVPSIPGYVILGELGRGGMGVVYRAEDSALGRQVALKVLKPELAANPEALGRFHREARAVAAISHDHVVPIYHIGDAGGKPWIVMPVLQGESLEARLARYGSLPPAEVSRIGREAALGLAAAHERGLVHRDIKPGNLWLEAPNDRVRVLDFGLARPTNGSEKLTRSGMIFGTPAYMAPEQANSEVVDARADLFGLGAVLYRAATGKPPFAGKTLTAILRAVAEHTPPAPHEVNPTLPRPLSELIVRMMAKDPANRPASAAEVADALQTLLVEVPITPREPEPRPAPKWKRWRLVPVLLFLGLVGWSLTRGDGDLGRERKKPDDVAAPVNPVQNTPVRYRGMVDVLVERVLEKDAAPQLVRLDDPRALPMRGDDRFRIEATIDPPAYLYLVWVDPSKSERPDITPVHPWNPEAKDGWITRPAKEEPTGKLSLPPDPTDRYTAVDAKPGVATIILLARPTPLAVPDAETRKWFEQLPDLPLPPGGERGSVWFDDYLPVSGDARRPRSFKIVGTDDPFVKWQSRLKKAVNEGGGGVVFQTAISFARTGGK